MNLKNFSKRLDSKTSCLRITVPENLDLALEGLIRKVLKEQPKTDDIYSFAANYFETLLKIRDKAGAKFTAAQLCPFHNDEDAHEMIKLAGTFAKPQTEKLQKTFPSKATNPARKKEAEKDKKEKQSTFEKVQTKINTIKSKTKGSLKDESAVEQIKRATPDLIKKVSTEAKSILEEEETERIKLANKSAEDNTEKKVRKEESDDEEFLASDPIKELVEKELMEAKLNDKRKNLNDKQAANVNISESPEVVLTNETNQQLKSEDKDNKKPVVNDIEAEGNKNQVEGTTNVNEKEVKIKGEKVEEFINEQLTDHVNKNKTEGSEETYHKKSQEVEAINNENSKDVIKSKTRKTEEIIEADLNVEDSNEEKANLKETNTETEDSPDLRITDDKTSEFPKFEEQVLNQEKQTQEEKEINQQSGNESKAVSVLENKEKSFENSQDETENYGSEIISQEILDRNHESDADSFVKKEEKNVETSAEGSKNETKPKKDDIKEVESHEQQPDQVETSVPINKETKPSDEIRTTEKHYKTVAGNKENESLVKTENEVSDAKDHNGEVEINDNQKQMTEKENMIDNTLKLKKADTKNSRESKTEAELHSAESVFQAEQLPEGIEKVQEIQTKETESKCDFPKNEKKSSEREPITNKFDNAIQEDAAKKLKDKDEETDEAKEIQKRVIKANESPADPQTKLSMVSNTDANAKTLEEKQNKLSSSNKNQSAEDSQTGNFNPQQPLDATIQNRIINFEKSGKLAEENHIIKNENNQTNKNTSEQTETADNNNIHIESLQEKEMGDTQQVKTEEKQTSVENSKFRIINKETTMQEDENVRQEEFAEKLCAAADTENVSETNKEYKVKASEQIKPDETKTEDTQSKDHKKEPEELCNMIGSQQSDREEKLEKKDEKLKIKTAVEGAKSNKNKLEIDELSTESDAQEVNKENQRNSEKSIEGLNSDKPEEDKTKHKEDDAKLEEELCTVIDIQHIPKADETDEYMSKENFKPEALSKKNTKTEEPITDVMNLHLITTEEAEKPKENKETFQSPGELQIKTIQTHYYETLQVPATVTKKYKVHSVAAPPINGLLSVVSSLQPNSEPLLGLLNQEKRNDRMSDVNVNALPPTGFVKNVLSVSTSTETDLPTENTTPDFLPPIGELKNIQADGLPTASETELNSETQRSDSDDLPDLTTPTSSYFLNLSELSWQTVSGLFLDSEKRYSSSEKEEVRYVTPSTNEIAGKSEEQKSVEDKQEVEEIIQKTIVSSKTGAVPLPPRETEEINEEANTETSESLKEKKEGDKTENESSESSTNSSVDRSSENNNTPIISVEVKTIIETQTLDEEEEEEDDGKYSKKRNGKEGIFSDVEIKVEAIVEIPGEGRTKQVEAPEEKKKLFEGNSREQSDLKSTEIQGKSQNDKQKEDSLTSKEGSSGESDSTISSAATEIKRSDSTKRNFSSTRSLLSTQSLDLGKKNPLMKTRSLSTFRHGVTDFEIWNTIEKELEEAATKIQSKFRGYKTRKKLQRENAVQITTEESSVSTTPAEPEIDDDCQKSTGEFHDSIVLSEHPR